MSQHR